ERTHVLTNVAPEHPKAELVAELHGNGVAVFDGQVRDAASCVELARARESARGTGVEAARAGSAALFDRLIGRELRAGHQHREQYVGAEARHDEAAVLSDEA